MTKNMKLCALIVSKARTGEINNIDRAVELLQDYSTAVAGFNSGVLEPELVAKCENDLLKFLEDESRPVATP